MSEFQPGEIVDITIKGVRIQDQYPDGSVRIEADTFSGAYGTWHMPPQAAVTRVAPAEWPPRPGDLWRDNFGDLWFGTEMNVDGDVIIDLRCAIDKVPPIWDGDIIKEYGPLTLVHREEEQDADTEQHGGDSCEECETTGRNCTAHGGRPGVTPAYPVPGSDIPGQPGYVVGTCGHRVAGSEWRAGYRVCERCPYPDTTGARANALDSGEVSEP